MQSSLPLSSSHDTLVDDRREHVQKSEHELVSPCATTVFETSSIESLSAREQARVLDERAPLAEELATLAFEDKNQTAWRFVQNGIFSLPMFKVTSGLTINNRHRPFFRGDLVSAGIRDIVWDVEQRNLPRLEPPKPLVGEAAAEFIEGEFRKRSVLHHPMFHISPRRRCLRHRSARRCCRISTA